jgi:hypothetical protein
MALPTQNGPASRPVIGRHFCPKMAICSLKGLEKVPGPNLSRVLLRLKGYPIKQTLSTAKPLSLVKIVPPLQICCRFSPAGCFGTLNSEGLLST